MNIQPSSFQVSNVSSIQFDQSLGDITLNASRILNTSRLNDSFSIGNPGNISYSGRQRDPNAIQLSDSFSIERLFDLPDDMSVADQQLYNELLNDMVSSRPVNPTTVDMLRELDNIRTSTDQVERTKMLKKVIDDYQVRVSRADPHYDRKLDDPNYEMINGILVRKHVSGPTLSFNDVSMRTRNDPSNATMNTFLDNTQFGDLSMRTRNDRNDATMNTFLDNTQFGDVSMRTRNDRSNVTMNTLFDNTRFGDRSNLTMNTALNDTADFGNKTKFKENPLDVSMRTYLDEASSIGDFSMYSYKTPTKYTKLSPDQVSINNILDASYDAKAKIWRRNMPTSSYPTYFVITDDGVKKIRDFSGSLEYEKIAKDYELAIKYYNMKPKKPGSK